MASTWQKKKVYPVNTFSNWKDINWAGAYHECLEAQEMAVDTLKAERDENYRLAKEAKEREHEELNPEGGSYEGDVSEEVYLPSLDRNKVFRAKLNASDRVLYEFVDRNHLKTFGIKVLDQILKHISTYPLTTIAGEAYDPKLLQTPEFDEYGRVVPTEGQVDAAELYRKVFTDDTMMGVYNFLMMDSRSAYLSKQYLTPSKAYCALVPLTLYAFKLHKGVPYSHWSAGHLRGVINPKLYDAMMFTPDEPFTKEELLAARAQGLQIKSGKDEGKSRNPVYTFKLFGADLFKGVPELAQTMLSQIWCAHPDNRTKYMVLDPVKWDNIPAPLITKDVAIITPTRYVSSDIGDMPWD